MTSPKTTPTTNKQTPAPAKQAAPAKTAAPAPVLDLTKLTTVKAPAPKVEAGAGRKAEDNSVAERWITESWDEREKDKDGKPVGRVGGGRSVTVPTAVANTLVSKLRRAAKTKGLGLSVKTTESADKATTNVNFAAKTAKIYPKK